MYLKKIKCENYGCIENLQITAKFDENDNPMPIIIMGKNGTGKTLLLSNIIHSLLEFKKKCYINIKEVNTSSYYRASSKTYIKDDSNYAYNYLEYRNSKIYTDLMLKDYDLFKNNFQEINFPNIDVDDAILKDSGFYMYLSDVDKKEFEKHIFIYCPVDRFYIPKWLNKTEDPDLFSVQKKNIVGENEQNIISSNVLKDIQSWIVNLIFDSEIYEKKEGRYSGKNTAILEYINRILAQMFESKNSDSDYITTHIGVGFKGDRKISIMHDYKNRMSEAYVHNIDNLSSGEAMILGIFLSILRAYDDLYLEFDEKKLEGIVLIDEIDIHLHSDYCRFTLPKIMKLFPKMQFIVTSHSPFFLLGIKDEYGDDIEFINMPRGIDDLRNFDEIEKAYELVNLNYDSMVKKLDEYEQKISKISKTIIITEGKTDWKHIKNALVVMKRDKKFLDLDIEFFEFDEDMGNNNLNSFLKNLAKVPQSNKIIGIFDTDDLQYKEYCGEEPIGLGNNVFAWSIPDKDNTCNGISIEFLYNRCDLQLKDVKGRRIFTSDEFDKCYKLIEDPTIHTFAKKEINEYHNKRIVKIIDAEVYSTNGSIALSKSEFANNILQKISPFDTVDVSNFKELFERIMYIIDLDPAL